MTTRRCSSDSPEGNWLRSCSLVCEALVSGARSELLSLPKKGLSQISVCPACVLSRQGTRSAGLPIPHGMMRRWSGRSWRSVRGLTKIADQKRITSHACVSDLAPQTIVSQSM